MALGDFVRSERRRRGLTQQELAVAASVDMSYISKIENARLRHTPSAQTLAAIAKALGAEELAVLELAGKLPSSLEFAASAEARAFLEAARHRVAAPEDWSRLTEYVESEAFGNDRQPKRKAEE